MTLKVGVQMDPIHLLNFKTDSTICLIKEAQKRGFLVYCYTPKQMFFTSGKVYARCQSITITVETYELGCLSVVCLEEFDVILMRQEPPFDMEYITATYLLEKIHPHTLIVNNPKAVRDLPEKLFICNYPEFMPPTMVAQDIDAIKDFFLQHKKVVLKPLYSFGGTDIFLVDNEEYLVQIFSHLVQKYSTAVVVQKFLPEVKLGDKRVILINGQFAGAVNRVPSVNDFKANLVAGGTATKTEISTHELQMCQVIGKELLSRGIMIAGIDIIGEYITEINVTCPTTFVAMNELYRLLDNHTMEALTWDAIILSKVSELS